MEVEFEDLLFDHYPTGMGVVCLLVVYVMLIMQTVLTAWAMHLRPEEIRALQLP